MKELLESIVAIVSESAPYLLLGFALAGVLHVVLGRFPALTARLTGPGRRPILYAALIGVPMPLCSCSVLPAAMALRRRGAGRGATASFLVSVPETDIVSILVTLALIGPAMAIYRPLAAFASAIAIGLLIHELDRRIRAHRRPAAGATVPGCHCDDTASVAAASAARISWWRRACHYGFVEIFDDIAAQLVLGILLAAMIGAWLPSLDPGSVAGGTFVSYLIMAAIGVPLYVCAAASTPIAAGLIAGGLSPGAALVFLLAGPATNLASLVVLRAEFGLRFVTVYVASIVVMSIAFGAAFDAFVGRVTLAPGVTAHAHHGTSWFAIACAVLFGVLVLVSFRRTGLLTTLRARLARTATRTGLRRPPTNVAP